MADKNVYLPLGVQEDADHLDAYYSLSDDTESADDVCNSRAHAYTYWRRASIATSILAASFAVAILVFQASQSKQKLTSEALAPEALTCASFTCPNTHFNKGDSVQRSGIPGSCNDIAICCEPKATCQKSYSCSEDSSLKIGFRCSGNAAACDADTCCLPEAECDWQCYLDRYPTLGAALGKNNLAAAKAHYEKHGRQEGRHCNCPPKECNWQCYSDRYSEFAFTNDAAAKDYYERIGANKGHDCTCPPEKSSLPKSAGIMYSVWHTIPAWRMRQVKEKGGEQLTVERVIRSDGQKTLDDVYQPYNVAPAEIYNVEPAEFGFYCLFTRRPGLPSSGMPDCPNATAVARRHAELIHNAGFDYIFLDLSNWFENTNGVILSLMRPIEVLMDTWLDLRSQGIPTPWVVAWPITADMSYASGNDPCWKWILDNVYSHPKRSALVWKRPGNGDKMTYFVKTPNRNLEVDAFIANNYGRNDIEIISVWTSLTRPFYDEGNWGHIAACNAGARPTTSLITEDNVIGECHQFSTPTCDGQNIAISASDNYHLPQSSLPFASPGHMRGLGLHIKFKKILAESPPNLLMLSFNEFIGGRQPSPQDTDVAFTMGLPNDPQRYNIWSDTYAAEYSRDIEPNAEVGGDRIYQVAKSCVQLYKAGKTCADGDASSEPCCTTEDKQIWNNVWSLKKKDGTDFVLTRNHADMTEKVASGLWIEICNAISGTTVFCVGNRDGRDGPFLIYNRDDAVPASRPLVQCFRSSTAKHFPSNDPNCEGETVADVSGYVATSRGGETLRALRRCLNSESGVYTHALDLPCPAGSQEDGLLGFVK